MTRNTDNIHKEFIKGKIYVFILGLSCFALVAFILISFLFNSKYFKISFVLFLILLFLSSKINNLQKILRPHGLDLFNKTNIVSINESTEYYPDKAEFSSCLRQLREFRNLSIEQASTLIGIAKSTLYSYENGTHHPNQNNLESLANAYNIPIDILKSEKVYAFIDSEKVKDMVAEGSIKPISNSELSKLWSKWTFDIHCLISQIERQNKALKPVYKPFYILPEYGIAVFNNVRNYSYITKISECSCHDFKRRNRPCKHMYRLASELSLYDLSYKELNYPLDKNSAIKLIEKLSINSKMQLKSLISSKMYKSKVFPIVALKNEFPLDLLNLEFVKITDGESAISIILNKLFSKDELINKLNEEDFKVVKSSYTKAKIIDYMIKFHNQVCLELSATHIVIDIDDNYEYLFKKIYHLISHDE